MNIHVQCFQGINITRYCVNETDAMPMAGTFEIASSSNISLPCLAAMRRLYNLFSNKCQAMVYGILGIPVIIICDWLVLD